MHPSVYFLLFYHTCSLTPLNTKESELQKSLINFERRMLGMKDNLVMNHGFWAGSDPVDKDILEERWPIRVLVCGNTGVGKSTLINKVFGVPVVRCAPS